PDEVNWWARSSDRPGKIFGLESSSIKGLDVKDVNELRSRTLLEVTAASAEGLTIAKLDKGKTAAEVAFNKTDKAMWRFKLPADLGFVDFEGAPKEAEQPGLKKVLDEVAGIRVEKVSDFVPLGNKSMADFGLADDNATLRIDVKYTEPNK